MLSGSVFLFSLWTGKERRANVFVCLRKSCHLTPNRSLARNTLMNRFGFKGMLIPADGSMSFRCFAPMCRVGGVSQNMPIYILPRIKTGSPDDGRLSSGGQGSVLGRTGKGVGCQRMNSISRYFGKGQSSSSTIISSLSTWVRISSMRGATLSW